MNLSYPDQRDYERRAAAKVRAVLREQAWQKAWAEGDEITPNLTLALFTPSVRVRIVGEGVSIPLSAVAS